MTKELDEFKESLKEMTIDELGELEQKVIKEADEVDKELTELEFSLPKENVKTIASNIRDFLDKYTVKWSYTLTIVELIEFWKFVETASKPKIKYHFLDKTLRILGELQYTGYNECKAIVDINKYFEKLKEKYIEASTKIYIVSEKHNLVMNEMQLKTPIVNQ